MIPIGRSHSCRSISSIERRSIIGMRRGHQGIFDGLRRVLVGRTGVDAGVADGVEALAFSLVPLLVLNRSSKFSLTSKSLLLPPLLVLLRPFSSSSPSSSEESSSSLWSESLDVSDSTSCTIVSRATLAFLYLFFFEFPLFFFLLSPL